MAQVPLVAPLRPLLNFTDGRGAITRAYQLMGGAPKPLVKWAFQLSSVQKLVTKPIALATHLDDADFLAQIEAVDRFTDGMIAYPGRTFGQLYHRFVKGNALVTGEMELGGRQIRMSAITVPGPRLRGRHRRHRPGRRGQGDGAAADRLPEVRFEIVPGGHLGMLTGRAARGTTWRAMDEWISQWSTAESREPAKPKKASHQEDGGDEGRRQEDGGQEGRAKKAVAKKAVAKKAAPTPVVKDADTIGANPTRRYGSAGSRSLAR